MLQLIQGFLSSVLSALKKLDPIERARIIVGCAAVLCMTYVILQSLGVFPATWWPN